MLFTNDTNLTKENDDNQFHYQNVEYKQDLKNFLKKPTGFANVLKLNDELRQIITASE